MQDKTPTQKDIKNLMDYIDNAISPALSLKVFQPKVEVDYEKLLSAFLYSDLNRAWIESKYSSFYVKKASRMIDGEFVYTLECNNIIVHDPYKRQGHLNAFLMVMQKQEKYNFLYIENANSLLSAILINKNWQVASVYEGGSVVSFYKKLNKNA